MTVTITLAVWPTASVQIDASLGSEPKLLAMPPSLLLVQAIMKGTERNPPHTIRKELGGKFFPLAEVCPFTHLMGVVGGDGGLG